MPFVTELKRRKVFKVGGAYLVVGWLLIQVVATVAPQLQLPDWAPRLITLLLMVGFPVAVILAWALEVTPEGVKVEAAPVGNKRMYAIAAALAATAIGWYFLTPGKEEKEGGQSHFPVDPLASARKHPRRKVTLTPFFLLPPRRRQGNRSRCCRSPIAAPNPTPRISSTACTTTC